MPIVVSHMPWTGPSLPSVHLVDGRSRPRVAPGRSGSHPAMRRLDHIEVSVIPVSEMVSIFRTAPAWPKAPPQTAPIPRVGPPAGRAILKSGPKEAPEGGAMDGGLTSSAGVLILSRIGCEPGFPRSARFFGGWGKGSQGWSLSGGSRGIRRGWLGGGYGQPFGPFPYVFSRYLEGVPAVPVSRVFFV